MSKILFAMLLRAISYVTVLLAIGWIVFENYLSPRQYCSHAMSCMGNAIGDAVVQLAVLCGAVLLGALLNTGSFFLQSSPRSRARKAELWLVFLTPLALLLAIAAAFILDIR